MIERCGGVKIIPAWTMHKCPYTQSCFTDRSRCCMKTSASVTTRFLSSPDQLTLCKSFIMNSNGPHDTVQKKRPLGGINVIPPSPQASLTCHQCLQTVQKSQYFQTLVQWWIKYGRGHITRTLARKHGKLTDWINWLHYEGEQRDQCCGLKARGCHLKYQ